MVNWGQARDFKSRILRGAGYGLCEKPTYTLVEPYEYTLTG